MSHEPLAPVVSVVVPTRNAEATLGAQLQALFEQVDAPPFEIVVADNGSTDSSAELVVALSSRSPAGVDVVVIDCAARTGVSAARNAGVAKARADLMLVCDADDIVSPQWVREMVKALSRHDLVGGALDETALNPELDASHHRGLDQCLPVSLQFLPYAVGANVGMHRSVVEAIGGWDESYVGGGDDVDFSWRAQLAGFTLGFAENAVIAYRLRTDLKGSYIQAYRYARSAPKLYRRYQHQGARRRGTRSVLNAWLWIITRSFALPFASYGFRRKWLRRSGQALGRIVGSISNRVLYL
jgi:GT2 family glycosyltransferase